MTDIEVANDRTPAMEGAKETPLLDQIRERLRSDPSVFFAGELVNPDEDGNFDTHDFFVSPQLPTFNPDDLTEFMTRALYGIPLSGRPAFYHQDGDLQLPDTLTDHHIGDVEVKTRTIVARTVRVGAFRDIRGQDTTETEETTTQKLIQRSKVKVFTDPLLAQLMFDYCQALLAGTLDELRSDNNFPIYATHILPADRLEELRKYYAAQAEGRAQIGG